MAENKFIKIPKPTDPELNDLPKTEVEWVSYVNGLHDISLRDKREQERQWVVNLAFYLGHQNLVFNRTSGIIDFDREERLPLVVNRVGSFVESRLAKLTKNRPISKCLC